jgi:hypothetical protein
VSVAAPASVRKVFEVCLAAMLFSYHMIDLVREEAYVGRQQTELTPIPGPLDDLASQ